MAESPLLNRRFIRLQAVQRLYSFYIGKKASYDKALDQIRADFIPDIFDEMPADGKLQCTKATQEALSMFADALVPTSTHPASSTEPNYPIRAVVAHTLASYKQQLVKDQCHLENGFKESVTTVNQVCVRIWQLLIVWRQIAQQRANATTPYPAQILSLAEGLRYSLLLQRLQDDALWSKQVENQDAGWAHQRKLVEGWYDQFISKGPNLSVPLAFPMTPSQDQQFLIALIDGIIFHQGVIQAYFSDLDLQWEINRNIVKKLVRQGSTSCLNDVSTSLASAQVLRGTTQWGHAHHFYQDLIRKTLQQDASLELLIAEKSKNWAIERIFLLDKTIIKLALCELLYFENIPIKVSINEYIDISKIYNTPKSSRFVNGLLNAVAETIEKEC